MDSSRRPGAADRAPGRVPHPQRRRAAATAEITSALIGASLLAGAVFLSVAGPALFGTASAAWIQHGQWAGSSVFIARVLWVLLAGRAPLPRRRQPSRPGRTSPDS